MLRDLGPSMSLPPCPQQFTSPTTVGKNKRIKDKKRQKCMLTYFTILLTAFRLLLN
jgi:hypothetical protein